MSPSLGQGFAGDEEPWPGDETLGYGVVERVGSAAGVAGGGEATVEHRVGVPGAAEGQSVGVGGVEVLHAGGAGGCSEVDVAIDETGADVVVAGEADADGAAWGRGGRGGEDIYIAGGRVRGRYRIEVAVLDMDLIVGEDLASLSVDDIAVFKDNIARRILLHPWLLSHGSHYLR